MKSLLAGIVLIIVIGLGGFIYRNVAERTGGPGQIACTADAKLCPDGTGVGRTGPSCEFASCPSPNVELAEAHLAFALPEGYERATSTGGNALATYRKHTDSDSVFHTLTISRYQIPEGKSADDVILSHTVYEPADLPAEDFSKFTTETIGAHSFRNTVIERFEGVIESRYYLARQDDVIAFQVVEHDVTNWTDSELSLDMLPEHGALRALLETLQSP